MHDLLMGTASSIIAAILVTAAAWIRGRLGLRLARTHPRGSAVILALLAITWLAANIGSILFQAWVGHGIWGAVSFILLTSLAFFYISWKEIGQFWRVGLRGADRSIVEGIDYGKALELCRNYLDFLGVGASKLSREDEFVPALLRCRPDVPIRFLLLSPSDENLRAAAMRAGKSENEYRDLVLGSLRSIADIKKKRNINIEVRFYSEDPIFRLMFVDRSVCLVSYNIFGEGDGSQLPQLHVVKSPGGRREVESFYYPFDLYFKNIWEAGETWDFQRFL